MEETINDIVEYIRRKTAPYSYLDQAQMFDELAGRMSDMNADALQNDYIADGMYC